MERDSHGGVRVGAWERWSGWARELRRNQQSDSEQGGHFVPSTMFRAMQCDTVRGGSWRDSTCPVG